MKFILLIALLLLTGLVVYAWPVIEMFWYWS